MTRWQDPESIEQRLFVQRLRTDPRTKNLPWFAVPNGSHKSINQAKLFKAEGLRAGVPDLIFPIADGGGRLMDVEHFGLAIEMKRPDNKGRLSKAQEEFHGLLRTAGWRVEVCRTAEHAWGVLAEHLHF